MVRVSALLFVVFQECESKIAQEIASLSKEDVSKEEMTENEEEVINLLLAQVSYSCTQNDAMTSTGRCPLASDIKTAPRLFGSSGERDPDGAGGADLSRAGAA